MNYLSKLTGSVYIALEIRKSSIEKPPLWRIYERLAVRRGKHVAEVVGHGVTGELAEADALQHVQNFIGAK